MHYDALPHCHFMKHVQCSATALYLHEYCLRFHEIYTADCLFRVWAIKHHLQDRRSITKDDRYSKPTNRSWNEIFAQRHTTQLEVLIRFCFT